MSQESQPCVSTKEGRPFKDSVAVSVSRDILHSYLRYLHKCLCTLNAIQASSYHLGVRGDSLPARAPNIIQ